VNGALKKTDVPAFDSNAVPALVRNVAWREGVWHRLYEAAWPKLPSRVKRFLPKPFPAAMAQFHAIMALEALGPQATGAVPGLLRVLKTDRKNSVRPEAPYALLLVDKENPKVRAGVMEALKDPDPQVRGATLVALINVHAEGPDVASAVRTLVNDTNVAVRTWADQLLRRITAKGQ
jgi:HEAT repeat protein